MFKLRLHWISYVNDVAFVVLPLANEVIRRYCFQFYLFVILSVQTCLPVTPCQCGPPPDMFKFIQTYLGSGWVAFDWKAFLSHCVNSPETLCSVGPLNQSSMKHLKCFRRVMIRQFVSGCTRGISVDTLGSYWALLYLIMWNMKNTVGFVSVIHA